MASIVARIGERAAAGCELSAGQAPPGGRFPSAIRSCALSVAFVIVLGSSGVGCKPPGEPGRADAPAGLAPVLKSEARAAVQSSQGSALPGAAAQNSPRVEAQAGQQSSVFTIGPGVYEFTAPGAELLRETERTSAANITITGGVRLTSVEVTASQARAQVEDIKQGRVAHLGDVVVSWSLIVYATPRSPGQVKNPQAHSITVNGLSGFEIRGERHITWGFPFSDHTLMVTARGPAERLDSPEVQTILHSLRSKGPIPEELASRAKSAGGQAGNQRIPGQSDGKDNN